jgi:hypothetical protein
MYPNRIAYHANNFSLLPDEDYEDGDNDDAYYENEPANSEF